MTAIQSSILPFYFNGISNSSQLGSSPLISNQLDLQTTQSTSTASNAAYSLDLSQAALNMFGGSDNSGGDATDGILNALTYSNYSNTTSSSSYNSIEAMLGLSGTDSSSSGFITPTSDNGPSFEEATLADGGPLPAYLAYVDKAMNLTSTQAASLQNIANENMDIPGDTPAVVQQIATELQQAGIPETV